MIERQQLIKIYKLIFENNINYRIYQHIAQLEHYIPPVGRLDFVNKQMRGTIFQKQNLNLCDDNAFKFNSKLWIAVVVVWFDKIDKLCHVLKTHRTGSHVYNFIGN